MRTVREGIAILRLEYCLRLHWTQRFWSRHRVRWCAMFTAIFKTPFFPPGALWVRVGPSWKHTGVKGVIYRFHVSDFLSWLTCMFFPHFYVMHGFMLLHLPNLASSHHTWCMFCLFHLLSCNGPRCALTTHLCTSVFWFCFVLFSQHFFYHFCISGRFGGSLFWIIYFDVMQPLYFLHFGYMSKILAEAFSGTAFSAESCHWGFEQ